MCVCVWFVFGAQCVSLYEVIVYSIWFMLLLSPLPLSSTFIYSFHLILWFIFHGSFSEKVHANTYCNKKTSKRPIFLFTAASTAQHATIEYFKSRIHGNAFISFHQLNGEFFILFVQCCMYALVIENVSVSVFDACPNFYTLIKCKISPLSQPANEIQKLPKKKHFQNLSFVNKIERINRSEQEAPNLKWISHNRIIAWPIFQHLRLCTSYTVEVLFTQPTD